MRKWSAKVAPAKLTPSMRPQRRRCGRRRRRRRSGARTVTASSAGRGRSDVTPLVVLVRGRPPRGPTARRSAGSAAIRSSRISSVRDWEMLTNGGNGERPWSTNVTRTARGRGRRCGPSSRSAPSAAIWSPAPTADQTSSTSRCWTIAFEPTGSRSGRASSSDHRDAPPGQQQRRGLPDRAGADHETGSSVRRASHVVDAGSSSSPSDPVQPAAGPRPRGRAARSRSAASRSRRARPTPAATSKGMQCSIDRPAPELRAQRGVGGLERLLDGAAGGVHAADRVAAGSSGSARVCSIAASTASRPRATAPRPPTMASAPKRLDRVEGAGRPVAVERVAGVERRLRLDQVAGEQHPLLRAPTRRCRRPCGRARSTGGPARRARRRGRS